MPISPRINASAEPCQDTARKSAGVMTGHGAFACCGRSVYGSSCVVFHCHCLAPSAWAGLVIKNDIAKLQEERAAWFTLSDVY